MTMPVRYTIHPAWVIALLLVLFNAPAQAIEVGDTAPDFTLEEVAGDTIALSSLNGRVVLLYFFGWD